MHATRTAMALLLGIAMLLIAPQPSWAAKRRAVAPGADLLSLTVAVASRPASAASILELGAHEGTRNRSGATKIVKSVVVTASRLSGVKGGAATLRVWIAPGSACIVRINRITLTSVPQTIDSLLEIGMPRAYTIEIEVATTLPEGPFFNGVEWEVTETR